MATTETRSPSDLTLLHIQEDEPGETIYDALDKWRQYPANIGPYAQPRNRPRLNEKIKHQFDRVRSNTLFTLDESLSPARKKAIERKIRTLWFDSSHKTEPSPTPTSVRRRNRGHARFEEKAADDADDKSQAIKSNAQLEFYLGIFGQHSQPRPDPIWRFIVLETSAPGSPRLKITDELLLKILSYHHVSPYFLDHISHICHEPESGVSEAPFSAFRALKSFSHFSPIPPHEALDRSGLHYQLVFDLKIVMNPQDNASTVATSGEDLNLWPTAHCAIYHRFDISTGKSIWILTPPGSTTSTGDGDGADSINVPPWSPNKSETTSELLCNFGVPSPSALLDSSSSSSSNTPDRFAASLSVMVWLADWSLSEYDAYIAVLDEQMQILSLPYINEKEENAPIYEITLKTYNQYMETLDQVIAALESNLATLQALVSFYCDDFVNDADLASLDPCPAWLQSTPPTDLESPDLSPSSSFSLPPKMSKSQSQFFTASSGSGTFLTRAGENQATGTGTGTGIPQPSAKFPVKIQPCLSDLSKSLTSISKTYIELISRANVVKTMGTRRESTTHRLLQNRDTTAMKQLQKLTYIFSTITLLLLPMSVVSTIFSTDIVRFAFPDDATSSSNTGSGTGTETGNSTSTGTDGNNGQAGPGVNYAGTWSKPAVVWWLVTTILATALVGGLGERWRRKSAAALKVGEGVVPSSRLLPKGSSSFARREDLLVGDGNGEKWPRRWTRRFKRAGADLEGRARAVVQWVAGTLAMQRQKWKWAGRGTSRSLSLGGMDGFGASGELEGHHHHHDPERADTERK